MERNAQRFENEMPYVLESVARIVAHWGRLAVNRTEAAEALGVSVEFFDQYVAGELRSVRRGRRVMYPISELVTWLWWEGDDRATDMASFARGDAPEH